VQLLAADRHRGAQERHVVLVADERADALRVLGKDSA
jgi:hypothetical protein